MWTWFRRRAIATVRQDWLDGGISETEAIRQLLTLGYTVALAEAAIEAWEAAL